MSDADGLGCYVHPWARIQSAVGVRADGRAGLLSHCCVNHCNTKPIMGT